MSEMERLIDMIGCDNAMPQERTRWTYRLIDLAHAEGVAEGAAEEKEKWIGGNETDEENDRRGQTLETRLLGKASVLALTKKEP